MPPSVSIRQLSKTFQRGKQSFKALDDVSLEINPGEMVALIGASGSGKSTLIRHIAGLVAGDTGSGEGAIDVLGRTVQRNGRLVKAPRSQRADTSVIFQQFNLVGRLSVLGNVCLGLLGRTPAVRGSLAWFTRSEKYQAMDALERVGMARFATQRASTLSGGQQQRVAVARALVQRARLILADEPVASLDPNATARVMDTLTAANREGIGVLVSLHQVSVAARYCPRTIAMQAGSVVYDGRSAVLTQSHLDELYGDSDVEEQESGNERIRQQSQSGYRTGLLGSAVQLQ